jgi:hypothetical protein
MVNYNNTLRFFPKFSQYQKIEQMKSKNIKFSFLKFLKTQGSWDRSGHRTSFNQIQQMIDIEVVKLVERHNNIASLKLCDGNNFNIRKQDEFHYTFVKQLYKKLTENNKDKIVDELFIHFPDSKNIYVNDQLIKIEKTEKTNDQYHYRTDTSINIRGFEIIIEYLEKYHEKEQIIDYPFEKARAFNLLHNNKSTDSQIVHFAFFWEHSYFNKNYFDNFVNHVYNKIVDYWEIVDEQNLTISKLTNIVNDEKLAIQLYQAHNNKTDVVISLKLIDNNINWNTSKKRPRDNWIDRFYKIIDNVVGNKNDFGQYYVNKKNDVFLSEKGLQMYLRIEEKYLSDFNEYERLSFFYNNIKQIFIDVAKEKQDKIISLHNDQIYGL